MSRCDGLVVVGWLGRDSTTLHCTHHVSTCRLKRHQSVFSFPPSLVLWLARCPLQPGKLPWAWLAGHSSTLSEGTAVVREQHRFPPSASAVREHIASLSAVWRDTAQGSAASWRPCNVAYPHQGPLPQLKLKGRPHIQGNKLPWFILCPSLFPDSVPL